MGGRLPQLKALEVIRALERLGFAFRRQTGGHVILRHPITKRIVSVPSHDGDIKRGLLFGIIKQDVVEKTQFEMMLRE
ncbi:type II toxin-antitoxin system HicA family toxin [Candidatus Uhrbacteria bacterium]|nr:type II toxin-antitoxin system HicA family toxin [Candidatus Uhrbacteria bacterium]